MKHLRSAGVCSFWSVICFAMILYSCNEVNKSPEYKTVPAEKMSGTGNNIQIQLSELVSLKDTICGMSLKDGISDTLEYNDKVYGFCSSGCKRKFNSILR